MDKRLNEALSREVAEQIKNKSRNSFEIAYQAALTLEGATYVQGFLVFPGKPYSPIEHSWIELGDQLIDPSFMHLDKSADELCYFPAHCLTVDQLKAAIEEAREDYPEDDPLPVYGAAPYEYYGDVMLGGKAYLTAYHAASARCEALNQPHAERN